MTQTKAQLIDGKSAEIEFSGGSASAPAISFTGDTNTGIYSPGADQLAISTNGTGRLFVDSSGNVGIGGSPTAKLDVRGTLRVEDQATSPSILLRDTDAAGDAQITQRNSGDLAIINGATTRSTIFETGGSERLRITSTGNVGIGTQAPNDILHVVESSASAAAPTTASVANFERNGSAGITISSTATTTGSVFFADSGASTIGRLQYDHNDNSLGFWANQLERLRITNSGNVGIGTSAPVAKLQVSASSTGEVEVARFRIEGQTNNPMLRVLSDEANKIITLNTSGSTTGTQLAFKVTNTEAVRIDGSGNVGIGTAAPVSQLHLQTSTGGCAVRVQSGSTYSGTVLSQNANDAYISNESGATGTIQFWQNGSEKARIDSSGRLLVGTSSGVQTLLDNPRLQTFVGDQGAASFIRGSNNEFGVNVHLAKSRNTSPGSRTIVQNNDELGSIWFAGDDGVDLDQAAARIYCQVDGTPGANDMPGRLVFSTTADGASSPTERMTIDSKGSTTLTSPSITNAALYVKSTGTSNHQRGIIINFPNRTPNDAHSYFLSASDSTASRHILMSNGGLHNYSANNVNLSDRNAKKDITPAAGTWDCLKAWEIVNFHYKDQPDDADLNLGVIAQQVAESCPEVVTVFQEAREATETEPAQEERVGVKDQQMIWMAIKALQEAQLRIETLEAEVAALKGT